MARRYMIFGGAGFIGSAIANKIKTHDDDLVVIVDNFLMNRQPDAHLGNRVINLDCSSVNSVTDLISSHRPTHVLHFAANSDIGKSFADPSLDLKNTFQTSASIAFGILESKHRVENLAFASSSAIFGSSKEKLIESSSGLPESPYGWMKLASEKMFETLYEIGSISKMHFFRFPNVTGNGQTHGVVKDLVRKYIDKSKSWVILGDGSQNKPYIHVNDLVDIILGEITRNSNDAINYLNIAPDDTLTVRQIVEIIQKRGGLQRLAEFGDQPFGWRGDVNSYSYDTNKMKSLGYRLRDSYSAVVDSVHEEFLNYGM
jgi:UDP-glucose 4-epimerase